MRRRQLSNVVGGLVILSAAGLVSVPAGPAAAAVASPSLVWARPIGGLIRESSPVAADIVGPKDIAVGGRDGNVYVVRAADGGDQAGWPRQTGRPIDASPAVADVDFDGRSEVFAGSGSGAVEGGSLTAFNADGSERWRFQPSDADAPSRAVFSSPALADVNSDGVADVNAFSLGLKGWSLSTAGPLNTGWPFYQDDTVFSSPALADVDGDGQTDYIVGGDSSPGGPVDHRGGFLRALRGNGSLIWSYALDEIVRSSPAVGDVDGDGVPEIVVGVGDYWVRQPGGARDATKLLVFDLGGRLKWSRDLGGYTPGSPALADVDGNGRLDIVQATWGGGNDGKVFVFDGGGSPLGGWNGRDSGGGAVLGQIVTADFDADGAQDLVVPTGAGAFVYSGRTAGRLFALREGVTSYQNSPWVGDLDGDGRLDIVLAGSEGSSSGVLHRFEMTNTTSVLGARGYHQFRFDNRHTGNVNPPPLGVNLCAAAPGDGYGLVGGDGGIFAYCATAFFGSTGGRTVPAPIVGVAQRPGRDGYWEVGADGGVYAFGAAKDLGSMAGRRLAHPVVGMAATPSGNGYWLVASDGGIFSFGDAVFHGSAGNIALAQPIVGMAASPQGSGYWFVAADGGIFAFGDARFFGSTGAIKLNKPIIGMGVAPGGRGYYLAASDGGIFAFGDAPFRGSAGAISLSQPVVGMAVSRNGNGYRLVARDGGIFSFGAPFLGSTGGIQLNGQVIGIF